MRFRTSLIVCALLLQVAVPLAARQRNTAKNTAGNGRVQPSDWPLYGRDLAGSHHNPTEKKITPATVARLKPRWVFETGGDINGQPIVVGGVVYFGSWDGKEYAVAADTGKKIWEFELGLPSRSGAAYADGVLYFGDAGGRLFALDAKTGAQKWKIKIDQHSATLATSSPIYHNGRIYIGVSSREELMPLTSPKYECCTFRGGVAAYDAKDGKEIWRFYTIPDPPTARGKDKRGVTIMGPAGGAVWSTIAIHPETNRLYVTTGNQYTGPPARMPNAIIALDLATGKVIWANQTTPNDIWTVNCRNDPDCLDMDFDFGTIPIAFKGPGGKPLIGGGQKSGWFYALDQKDGSLAWKTEVGPGGKLGGIEFGAATDGERVYVGISAIPNREHAGSVSALDGVTGKILWQTKSPDGGANFGPVTVTGTGANRLVFAGSSRNFIRAYDAKDGKVLWEHDTGGAVGCGATIVDGVLYVGSGYQNLRVGKPNNKLFAFSIDGK
jgi:polyvinyl alcohol dehydrogenase (cytochrome)